MKSLVFAAACAFGAACIPAHAAFEPIYFPEYTLSYDDGTVVGGLAFNSGGSGGTLGFGWNLPDTISLTDGTQEFVLPSFTLTAASGYVLSGWLSGFLGNLSYAEGAGGETAATIRGSVSIDGATFDFNEILNRTQIISTPGISTGYYSIGGSVPYGSFTSLEVSGLTLTLSATANAAVYSADQGRIEVGFVATPVPEPETWGMLLGGLGLISLMARRRLSC